MKKSMMNLATDLLLQTRVCSNSSLDRDVSYTYFRALLKSIIYN